MVTATIAASIPGAINAYRTVVDVANANILLTSTITKLRSELTGATGIKIKETQTPDGKKLDLDYTNGKGVLCEIEFIDSYDDKGIYYSEFKGADINRDVPIVRYLLVSHSYILRISPA